MTEVELEKGSRTCFPLCKHHIIYWPHEAEYMELKIETVNKLMIDDLGAPSVYAKSRWWDGRSQVVLESLPLTDLRGG